MSSLVIVESPAKAKTIGRILGPQYIVEASYGHVRDLPENADQIPKRVKKEPWARLGVNVQKDFEPLYIVPSDKKKYIDRLKAAMVGADEVLLATDEDREGESISWHVINVLKPSVPVHRIAFHEITDEAIHEALLNPRAIDENLVRAQESRRILDRLFGYQLSPVLWKKVRTGLSAGRVQSVCVRLCVERERERQRFRSARFWDAEASFKEQGIHFTARLSRLGDQKVATGADFEAETGELQRSSKARWLRTEEDVQERLQAWRRPWQVTSVTEKPFTRRPAPPFITATLQQEANRKLSFAARQTMRVAQRLYEGVDMGGERVGLITYMRTDSVTLSNKALGDAQALIQQQYGNDYTDGPRRYSTKSKGAQEAHEAIRPTEIARTPEKVSRYLQRDEQRLYELIWKRTVASQMTDARLRRTAIEITASDPAGGPAGIFTANGKSVEFPGFLRAYVEGSDDPEADLADREVLLPNLRKGNECDPEKAETRSHETQPPARYTEASLVKKLEAEGIGRPSTYATIIDTIQNRGYIDKQGNALVPTFTAFAVTDLLERHFADYVDLGFTARMEQQLDEIATGELDWKAHLHQFYFGEAEEPGLERRIQTAEPNIDYPQIEIGVHPENQSAIVAKVGRYGPYLQWEKAEGERISASLPDGMAPADLTLDEAVTMLQAAQEGARELGTDPETDLMVYLDRGRFGPYVQLGETPEDKKAPKPKRASVPKGLEVGRVTLEAALKWLSLPRTLGQHPENGEDVVAASGRFGPFIKCDKETRSLTADDDVYNVTLERALELLAQPKRRGRAAARTVLKEFGEDKDGNKVQLLDGRYGPYLTNGELNASLPQGTTAETLTPESAAELLASRGKAPKRGRKRTTTKAASPKKASPKKKTTRKKVTKK